MAWTHRQIAASYPDFVLDAIAEDWSVRGQWPERYKAVVDEIRRREIEDRETESETNQ